MTSVDGADSGFVEYSWFDPDPDSPTKYYERLLERRQQILSLDCNTRGRMQQEWISLIVEMDAVMRVCHAHLGTVNFTRPRGRSFRGESFVAAPPTREASRVSCGALRVLSNPHACTRGERVAVGYIRLPVTRETSSKAARGQTLQPAVVLRQFWRHPSWPDPDQTFIWPHQSPSGTSSTTAEEHTSGTKATVPLGVKQPEAKPQPQPQTQPQPIAGKTERRPSRPSSAPRRQSAPSAPSSLRRASTGGRPSSSSKQESPSGLTGPRGQPGPPSQDRKSTPH